MSLTTTSARYQYSGNGSATVFAFPEQFHAKSDLIVVVTVSGADTVKTLVTDYNVTGELTPSGGVVTFLTAPATGATVTIYRNPSATQPVDYVSGDSFPAETHERALDRLTMLVQACLLQLSRTLKVPVTSAQIAVPDVVTRAGKTWTFDTYGNLILTDFTANVSAAAASAAAAAASAAAAADSAVASALSANEWVEKSSDFTAALNGRYLVTNSCTVTDPTPSQGKVFSVLLRSGTVVVGGVSYTLVGTLLYRKCHSGVWTTDVFEPNLAYPRLENAKGLTDFYRALYSYTLAPTSYIFAVAHMGDSLGQLVPGELFNCFLQSIPRADLSFPAVNNAALTVSASSLVKRGGLTTVDQTVYNGIQSIVSITRSGSTATVTTATEHGFQTAMRGTVSGAAQSEYNGTFSITRISSTQFSYTVTGTPATPATGTLTVHGGLTDFTYLASGEQIEIENTGYFELDAGQAQGWDACKQFFAIGPGMGSVLVELINRDTSSVVSSSSTSLTNATLGATVVTFSGISRTSKYKIRCTATGAVVLLETKFLKQSGLVAICCNRGGSTFAQNVYSNSTLFTYILNNLNTALITITAKEENPTTGIPSICTRAGLVTSASKLVLGSLPDNGIDSTATQLLKIQLFRYNAFSFGYAFHDGYALFGSFAELNRLGLAGDGIHPSTGANRLHAVAVYSELGAMRYYGTTVREDIDHRGKLTGYVATDTFRVFRGDFNEGTVDVITNAGGGSGGMANLKNIRKMQFGSSGSYPVLLIYGVDGVQVSKEDETPGFLRARNVEFMGTANTSDIYHDFRFRQDGAGVLIKEGGPAAKMGAVTLVGGTATVNTTSVAATSRIQLTGQQDGGTPGFLRVSARVNGTSFTITSSSALDTSVVGWEITNPAP